MGLNDREKLILGTIIDYYLAEGDTIGSRSLVKRYDLDISSATVRNVMSDLEDMGYIAKTHISSGRVPTDSGYKFYLNELLRIRELTKTEIKKVEDVYERRIKELDGVLENTSKLLSKLTAYTGIVTEPNVKDEKVKKVQFVHINDYTLLLVMVMDNSSCKTKKIHLDKSFDERETFDLQIMLNKEISSYIDGISAADVDLLIRSKLRLEDDNDYGEYSDDREEGLFLKGKSNLLSVLNKKQGEIGSVVKLLDNKRDFKRLFEDIVAKGNYEEGKVHVIFGEEFNIPMLEDFSFVFSIYNVNGVPGIIGVMGPKRMEYSKTVGLIKYVTEEVNKVIKGI